VINSSSQPDMLSLVLQGLITMWVVHTCAGGRWHSYRWRSWHDSDDELLGVWLQSTIVSVVAELLGMLEPSPTANSLEPRRCTTDTRWWAPTAEAESRGRDELYAWWTEDGLYWPYCIASAVQHSTQHHKAKLIVDLYSALSWSHL